MQESGNITGTSDLNQSRDEYIRTLEMYVQLMQREIENLRNQLNPKNKNISNIKNINNINNNLISKTYTNLPEFNQASSIEEILNQLLMFFEDKLELIEINIYFYKSDKTLIPVSSTPNSSKFPEQIKFLEEQGIIDWAVEQNNPSVIPNIRAELNDDVINFIISPILVRGKLVGIFTATTGKSYDFFDEQKLLELANVVNSASESIENLHSAEEIIKMNKRLALMNEQMFQSGKLASIGELAASFAWEIDSPLHILKTNLQLLESGVGNSKRRFEIIKEQLDKINEINSRLSNIAGGAFTDISSETNQVSNLIDDVLLFSGSQLLRDGISIEIEAEDLSLEVIGIKSQIEQALLNILLFLRDCQPDGGKILIGSFKSKDKSVLITMGFAGKGLSQEDLLMLFEPTAEKKFNNGLYLAKNILQQHNGKLNIFSEPDKGITVKIILPSLESEY